MAAAGHEVGKADVIDLAQVGVIDPVSNGNDTGDIELIQRTSAIETSVSLKSADGPVVRSPTSHVPSASFTTGRTWWKPEVRCQSRD